MKAARLALVLIGVLAFGGVLPVLAFQEPDGFQGAKWGESEAVVRTKLGVEPPTSVSPGRLPPRDWACHDYTAENRWLGDRYCTVWVTIGDIRLPATPVFRGDKFVSVSFAFPEHRFSVMEGAFLERFGPPTSTKEDVIRTRAGVEYLNRTHRWIGPTVEVTLSRYGSRVTSSSASYHLRSDLETAAKLRQEGASKASKGLY